eukprot:gene15555-biopygen17050
MAVYRIAADT